MRGIVGVACAVFVCSCLAVFPAVSPARAALEAPLCVTQGELALAMAQLLWPEAPPQSAAAAMAALSKIGVEPTGGWTPEACAESVRAELMALVQQAIAAGKIGAENATVVADAFAAVQRAKTALSGGRDTARDRSSQEGGLEPEPEPEPVIPPRPTASPFTP